MRKVLPRYPVKLRSDILWDIVEDPSIEEKVRCQLREIARHIDGEPLRRCFIRFPR